jgi:Calcineurin-like phosphoesterase
VDASGLDRTAARTESSRESPSGAGWDCPEVGTYKELLPPGGRHLSWANPVPLFKSRNDWVSRGLGDPTNDQRRAWVDKQLARGVDPDFIVRQHADRDATSFVVIGDTGEGDPSQYCVVPGLMKRAQGTDFLFICSDVLYPAGDINEYDTKFYRPYRDYPGPIYAIPGNHDWYDGLNGFMHHFCGVATKDPSGVRFSGPVWRSAPQRLLWRQSSRGNDRRIAAMHELRPSPEQQPHQPGPYMAIEAGPILLVAIDTGISGALDAAQGEWLLRLSRIPKPKVLLTGKPLYVDGEYHPGRIEGTTVTVDDVVRAPESGYLAAIGGEIHNYQRYPVTLEDGRIVQYIVSGGGGAGSQGTHKIPRVDLPGIGEKDFRCYPLRGDSLARFSEMYDRRLGFLLGRLVLSPDEASALIAERLGLSPTREGVREVAVTPAARRAFRIVFPRRERLPGPLHDYFVQFMDWNDPPMFKSFLRIDATKDEVTIRCFSATGCRKHELDPPLEDAVVGRHGPDGSWQWSGA